MGKQRFDVNFRYIIRDVKSGIFDLENKRSGEKFKADRETVDKHFRHHSCITRHSARGATIKKNK